MTEVDQSECLGVLSQAPAEEVKRFADEIIRELGPIEVLVNRSGLAMLPMRDTVKGTAFYVGEVLIAEAHVRIGDAEGYGACLGRDLQHALAIAIVDAANVAQLAQEKITAFVSVQSHRLRQADEHLLRKVEATRVEMETF